MDRRSFIRRSFGAGALLATGQLALESSTVSAAAPATGFQVGQVIPKLRAFDQYDRAASLRDNSDRWTLLDVCPWWCQPCRESAAHHAAFSAYMNEQGIPFQVLTVLTANLFGGASNRDDAERWAVVFGLERDVVLHCAGDETSPLRQIVLQLWQANQPQFGPAAYPTYAILDPSGVIRHYQLGAGLNALQSALAELTASTLTGEWNGPPTELRGLARAAVLPARVTGVRSDSVPIDETLDGDGVGQFGSLFADSLMVGFTPGEPGFSLDAPLSIHFMPATPPVGGVYRLVASPEVSILPVTYPLAEGVAGSAQLTSWPDGSLELVCEPFRSYLPADADAMPWPTIQLGVYYAPTKPYSASMQLDADVAAATLPVAVATKVHALLQSVRDQLGKRDFAAAADKAAKAAAALQLAGAPMMLKLNAASLANLGGAGSASATMAAHRTPARVTGSQHSA